jgi:hypothetical protein
LKSTASLIVIALIALGGLPPLLPGALSQGEEPERTKFSSLQRSLIIPGWGQFEEKRYFEGSFFLSLEIWYLYEIFKNNRRGNSYYRLYKAAASTEEAVRYRTITEHYDKRRNIFMLVAAGVWAVNLVDIYVIVKKKGNKLNILDIKANVSQDKGLSIHYRFSF